jgi:hypothetical protein
MFELHQDTINNSNTLIMACNTCGGQKTTPQKTEIVKRDDQGNKIYEINGLKYIINEPKQHS